MTEGEKRSGKSWDRSGSDCLSVRTMKALLIGKSATCKKYVQRATCSWHEEERAYSGKLARKRKTSGIENIVRRNSLQSCSHEQKAKKYRVTRKSFVIVAILFCVISVIVNGDNDDNGGCFAFHLLSFGVHEIENIAQLIKNK